MKTKKSSKWDFYKKLGPGLITGASDDDPSGIATYTQAGAQFGPLTLWTALLTFPLMLAVQEMCARIGIVTGNGLAQNIKQHISQTVLVFILLFTLPAIVLNIGADLAIMGAVAHLMLPIIPADIYCVLFTIILTFCIIFLTYNQIVKFLKYFCLTLILYMIIPFITNTAWLSTLEHTFIPTIQWNREFLNILVAIFGATLSPYMFFWQATMAAEDKKKESINKPKTLSLKAMRLDVFTGMFASNLVMFFIILTSSTVLHQNGITQIETVEQAAKALEPLAGKFAYGLFTLGILGTGFLTIPVLSGCLSYVLTTTIEVKEGLSKKFYQAPSFYLIIMGALAFALIVCFLNISPIKALIWTAVLYGLTAPIMIALLLYLGNNKKIMKGHHNGVLANVFGGLALIIMTTAAVVLIYFLITE